MLMASRLTGEESKIGYSSHDSDSSSSSEDNSRSIATNKADIDGSVRSANSVKKPRVSSSSSSDSGCSMDHDGGGRHSRRFKKL